MRFGDESDIFGKEKDGSFKGSIGNIYQSFGGQDVYPTLEEKAAHVQYEDATAGFETTQRNGGNKLFLGNEVSDLHLVYTF